MYVKFDLTGPTYSYCSAMLNELSIMQFIHIIVMNPWRGLVKYTTSYMKMEITSKSLFMTFKYMHQ